MKFYNIAYLTEILLLKMQHSEDYDDKELSLDFDELGDHFYYLTSGGKKSHRKVKHKKLLTKVQEFYKQQKDMLLRESCLHFLLEYFEYLEMIKFNFKEEYFILEKSDTLNEEEQEYLIDLKEILARTNHTKK